MVTKEQYEFFARLFDEEAQRTASLNERAKWYLSLTAFYSAVIIFVAEKLRPETAPQLLVLTVSGGGMLLSFLLSLWGVRVAAFEGITAPSAVHKQLENDGFDQDRFFLRRIADFSAATESNTKVNNRQARALRLAGAMMLIGMAAHGLYFYLRLSEGVK
jgi:hypothetical protein